MRWELSLHKMLAQKMAALGPRWIGLAIADPKHRATGGTASLLSWQEMTVQTHHQVWFHLQL